MIAAFVQLTVVFAAIGAAWCAVCGVMWAVTYGRDRAEAYRKGVSVAEYRHRQTIRQARREQMSVYRNVR